MEYRVHYSPQRDTWEVFALDDQGYFIFKGGNMVHIDLEKYLVGVEPLFSIPNPEQLVQAFRDANIKPPKGSYVEGELKATKSHLEDIRKIALEMPNKDYETHTYLQMDLRSLCIVAHMTAVKGKYYVEVVSEGVEFTERELIWAHKEFESGFERMEKEYENKNTEE